MKENGPLETFVNETKARAWNEAIAPRATTLISYLSADEWTRGVAAFLSFQEEILDQKLRYGSKSRDDDQFIRGELAMLEQIRELPKQIQRFLDSVEEEKKAAKSRGPAGY